MDGNILIFFALAIYIFFIVLRYWKGALIYNLVAIVPLVVLLTVFNIEYYEFSIMISVLIIIHISDFIFQIRE